MSRPRIILPRLSRRHFLLAAGFSAAATRLAAQNPADEDVILKAMRDELARSLQLRVVGGGGDEAPYFIAYTLDDNDAFEVGASFGAVTTRSRNRFRLPNIEVRVGSYDFDNTGHIYSGYYSGSRYDTEPLPLDDDYVSLREGFWLATDHAYKAAVESIARKRAALASTAAAADRQPDFSKAEPVRNLEKVGRVKFDEEAWTARTVKLSAIFNSYAEVLAAGVEFHFNQDSTYVLNTEGTELRFRDDTAWFQVRAEGQAADGMLVRESWTAPALELGQVPAEKEVEQSVTAMASHVQALVKAPVGEAFLGPALFEPQAAAQLLAQLLGDNLHIQRKPISDPNRPVNLISSEFEGRAGARVLPDWMDVTDDPTLALWQGKALAGYYPFDFEGVKPKPVSLIEKGVLKGYLTTRQPAKNMPVSNGHGRFPAGFGATAAAIGNLFIKAAQTSPMADLKTRLIQMCKERDKPYGLLVRKLDFPYSGNNTELQALQAASAQSGGSVRPVSPPVLIYKVFPDGREELVRGLHFKGLSTRSLRDILAASAETQVFEYLNTGAPLARSAGAGYIAPTAVIAPGLLFDELEVDPLQDPLEKPALVPPPSRRATP
jgi:TldD protein